MQDSLVALIGKMLLWLGGGLFPIIVVAYTAVPPDADLAAWREVLALLFLGSVMIGTALVVADRELGEG